MAAEIEVLAETNSGTAKLVTVDNTAPPNDSFTGGKSWWWRGQRARLAGKRHRQLDRDQSQERDRPSPDIGATAKQTSSKIPGQRRRKWWSGPGRAGSASGQARLSEAVHRVKLTADLRAQRQRPRLHYRQALRKAVFRGRAADAEKEHLGRGESLSTEILSSGRPRSASKLACAERMEKTLCDTALSGDC